MLRSSLPTTIEIKENIHSKTDMVMADPTQIHQVIMNLCTNAAHAMRERGGILELILSPEDISQDTADQYSGLNAGRYIRIVIRDTGHGMDLNTVKRIFDPFFTTKERGEGTGLGLSIVYGIINNLGGTIIVESELGKGAIFSIFLPSIERADMPHVEEAKSLPRGSERILLVDDEEVLVEAQYSALKKLGYQVVPSSKSIEALEIFRSQPDKFDLVMTDQTMPKMTGVELARQIIEIRPQIPIILCTGFSEMISKEQAESLGIRAFVMKPSELEKIAKTLREVLDRINE